METTSIAISMGSNAHLFAGSKSMPSSTQVFDISDSCE